MISYISFYYCTIGFLNTICSFNLRSSSLKAYSEDIYTWQDYSPVCPRTYPIQPCSTSRSYFAPSSVAALSQPMSTWPRVTALHTQSSLQRACHSGRFTWHAEPVSVRPTLGHSVESPYTSMSHSKECTRHQDQSYEVFGLVALCNKLRKLMTMMVVNGPAWPFQPASL